MAVDFLNGSARKQVVDEITSEENRARKREHQKRFDVYRDRQDKYILEKLTDEFSHKTVKNMRNILSINLSKQIIDSMSSVYTQPPVREFSNANDRELEQISNLYSYAGFDAHMALANRYFNLFDQTALFIMPKNGRIMVKPLAPFHYDVVPDSENPEEAFAYIMNVWNFDQHKTIRDSGQDRYLDRYSERDDANQAIADNDDRKKVQERYVVWTKEMMFTMDGFGNVITEGGIQPNPIGRLPFIDIAMEKDFQFFVRTGSSITDFALDFGLILSDTANTIRLQNYSQAIMTSEKQPQNLVVGPNSVLWLPLDPDRPGATPKFEFTSPSPDIGGSLEFAEMILRLFLSSRGVDPATISGKGEAKSFSSGVERLLSMIDKFEASRQDFSLFSGAEEDAFDLMRLWSNEMQGVTTDPLNSDLQVSRIGDDVDISVQFKEPGVVLTQKEKEESVMRLLDVGLMSRKEAIMELRGVDEDLAQEKLNEIDEVSIGQIQEGATEVSGGPDQSEVED